MEKTSAWPPSSRKRVGEGRGRGGGVGVAVVDGRHPAQTELFVGEAGHGQRPVQGVVGDPVEAGVVVGAGVAGQVRGERGGDDGRGYGHQAGVADDRGDAGGGHRAGGADDADDLGVGGRGGGRGAAPGFGALRVESRPHPYFTARDGAVVLRGQGHGPLAGDAQVRGAAERVRRADLDGLPRPDLDHPQRPVPGPTRIAASRRGEGGRRCQSGEAESARRADPMPTLRGHRLLHPTAFLRRTARAPRFWSLVLVSSLDGIGRATRSQPALAYCSPMWARRPRVAMRSRATSA